MTDQTLPVATNRPIETPHGTAIGQSTRWIGGQYCAIVVDKGMVGCGIFDVISCAKFNQAVAIARGTPEHPLAEPEDLYEAKIVDMSKPAADLGVKKGMTGLEALGVIMKS